MLFFFSHLGGQRLKSFGMRRSLLEHKEAEAERWHVMTLLCQLSVKVRSVISCATKQSALFILHTVVIMFTNIIGFINQSFTMKQMLCPLFCSRFASLGQRTVWCLTRERGSMLIWSDRCGVWIFRLHRELVCPSVPQCAVIAFMGTNQCFWCFARYLSPF